MTELILSAAQSRAADIRRKLKRNKLVFVQCGAAFEVLRAPLLTELDGTLLDAVGFAENADPVELPTGRVILDNVEAFAADGKAGNATLGALRARVNQLRDREIDVCLVSRMPKIAFAPVPGSNLLDDAASHCLPLLSPEERPPEVRTNPGAALPAIGLGTDPDVQALLRASLGELDVHVLTDLDFAIFEANHLDGFVNEVEPAVAEALRGAGLAQVVDSALEFTETGPFWQFKNAVADTIAAVVVPQSELSDVSEGLWLIERTIRKLLREAAIEASGGRWRRNVFNKAIADSVLGRARGDVYATATTVSDLRDPTEWLSLGELLEVVQSPQFKGLSWDSVAWKHFTQDIVPIRNRLSHMRLLKKGDRATVRMWVNRVVRMTSS
ncbi:hypothetical protein [Amycolatopsis tolypomycina]|uniref:hypothetical protein n=1 Tax=Amycolatopsis tolypomycina TaxID=208445 RepID=UPI00339F8A30